MKTKYAIDPDTKTAIIAAIREHKVVFEDKIVELTGTNPKVLQEVLKGEPGIEYVASDAAYRWSANDTPLSEEEIIESLGE